MYLLFLSVKSYDNDKGDRLIMDNYENILDSVVSLTKRRGFVFQGSELYGGINGFWDYGPLGSLLKERIRRHWYKKVVMEREDVVLLDSSLVMHPDVWRASGHTENFYDIMVECAKCKKRYKSDAIDSAKCPECQGDLTEGRQFNLMFKTYVGALEEESSIAYLRPETAQAIFVHFKNVLNSSRQKIPFGIAQMGKSFRNEITPRNFIFRSREFEQMELEFFVQPEEDEKWYEFWVNERFNWYTDLGVNPKYLRLREHSRDELAHYATGCTDIEYYFPFGWKELEGIAKRTDFDLKMHMEYSKKDLSYFDEAARRKYIPFIVETSAGVERTLLTILCSAYREETVRDETRVVLGFSPKISPVQVAFLPLSKQLNDNTYKIYADLRDIFESQFDDKGSIGRRYRRQDEIGTPLCITFDFDSLQDHSVTIRHRDTMEQKRVAVSSLTEFIKDELTSF